MAISVNCTQCGKTLRAPDTAAGKRAKCPGCGDVVQLPAASEIVDVAPEPAPRVESASQETERKRIACPMCGEMIIATAKKCRFCGDVLDKSVSKTTSEGRYDPELGIVRTGITIIYYGLATLLATMIFGAILSFVLRQGPGGPPTAFFVVVGIGLIGGAVGMLVGKFFCLGVPQSVGGGATAMIWISCSIDVITIAVSVIQAMTGNSTFAVALIIYIAMLTAVVLFLFFLRRLAVHIERPDLAKLAVIALIMLGVTIGIIVLIGVFVALSVANALRGGRRAFMFEGAAGLLGFGAFIVGVITLCIYARLLTYLKDALKPR